MDGNGWYLGPLIASLRGEMGQAELGRRIGLSRERVGQIERGRVKWPEVDVFNALARELNVPVTKLMRAAGADIPEPPGDSRIEELEWAISQLDEEAIDLLADVAHGLLRRRRRPPRTEEQ